MKSRASFMLNCRDMAELLSCSMDRNLAWHTRFGIALHLRMCRLCQTYKKQLHLLRDLLRGGSAEMIEPEHSATPGLPAEAKRRIIQRIHALLQSRPAP